MLTTARHLSLSRTNNPVPPSHTIPSRYPLYYPPIYTSVLLVLALFPSGFLTNAFTLSDRYQTTPFQYTKKHSPYVTLAQISEDLVNKWQENKTTLLPATSRSWTKTATRGSSGGRGRSIADKQTLFEIIQRPLAVTRRSLHTERTTFPYIWKCYCLVNLCKWPSALCPSWSRHTIDHKSVTSRNSCTWRPISHFITTWQAPSQLQYIVSSNSARFQRVFQCVVRRVWKEMTTRVTTFTTWTFET